jgi:DNA polymerase III epsilon subunit family exonuclease
LPPEFVVLDLETTGLSPDRDEIIEVGAIRVIRDSDHHRSFQALVIPENGVPEHITEITGITPQMIRDKGLDLSVVLAEFVRFIGDLPLVTFNAAFDMGFLHNAANKHGIKIRNRHTCALQMARRAWPGLQSYRLVDLAAIAHLDDDDTHRALGDCKRTATIFCSAASRVGQPIVWDSPPIHWKVMVRFNEARDANRAYCAETRPLEVTNPALAVSRYTEAVRTMYEYGKLVDGRWGDEHILDRLTLCLGKLARYQELIESVDEFLRQCPQTGESKLMFGILRRRERALEKSAGAPFMTAPS